MAQKAGLRLSLLVLLCGACQGTPAPDPQDPEPRLRLSGKSIRFVVESLGDPDEVAEDHYFGTKFSGGPIAAVFKYHKDQLYIYINDKGIVLGVAKGSTKNVVKW